MADQDRQDAVNELQKLNPRLLSNSALRDLEMALIRASDALRVSDAFYLSVLGEMNSRGVQPERVPSSGQVPPAARVLGDFMGVRRVPDPGPLFKSSPLVPGQAIALNNGLPPAAPPRREREPSAQPPPSGLDAAFVPGTFEYYERRRRESAAFFRQLSDADIASNLTRYHTGRLFIDQGDVVGFLDVVTERLAQGRITFVYDPATKSFVYVVNGAQVATQGAVLISNGVIRQAIIDLAAQLAAESRFTGIEDVPFPNTPAAIGQIILGGVIGGVVPDLPGGQVPPGKKPRPPVDNAGNVKPPGPFPDELFRRNPPDP